MGVKKNFLTCQIVKRVKIEKCLETKKKRFEPVIDCCFDLFRLFVFCF